MCTYTIRSCLYRMFPTLTIVFLKANRIGTRLHHDWLVYLPTYRVLHEPSHTHTHAVDASLRKCIHDFPRRSNNSLVELLVDQRFPSLGCYDCSLVSLSRRRTGVFY